MVSKFFSEIFAKQVLLNLLLTDITEQSFDKCTVYTEKNWWVPG